MRTLILAGLTLALVLPGCLESPAPSATASTAPLPLDPLSDEEEARAIEIAAADAQVASLVGGERHRVIGAALRTDKSMAGRLADVHVYRYGSGDVVWPVVDLTTGRVLAVTVERFQPRLVEEEVAEAEAAVKADAQVLARLATTGGVDGTTFIAILKNSETCPVGRCLEGMLMRGDVPAGTFLVEYDLGARVVTRVWDLASGGVA